MVMRVYLGSDHAGYELKNHLVEWLKGAGHEPVDCGPHIYDAEDDYPPFCLRAAERTGRPVIRSAAAERRVPAPGAATVTFEPVLRTRGLCCLCSWPILPVP